MKAESHKTLYVLLLVAVGVFGYCLWVAFRPVEIVAVHHRTNGFSSVLVRNFPLTDRGKITWWLKNKAMLKEKYDLPKSAKDGDFTVTFWLFGDGYKEGDGYDSLCFEDMKPPVNCIDKNKVFTAENDRNRGVLFVVKNGVYRINENDKIVKKNSE